MATLQSELATFLCAHIGLMGRKAMGLSFVPGALQRKQDVATMVNRFLRRLRLLITWPRIKQSMWARANPAHFIHGLRAVESLQDGSQLLCKAVCAALIMDCTWATPWSPNLSKLLHAGRRPGRILVLASERQAGLAKSLLALLTYFARNPALGDTLRLPGDTVWGTEADNESFMRSLFMLSPSSVVSSTSTSTDSLPPVDHEEASVGSGKQEALTPSPPSATTPTTPTTVDSPSLLAREDGVGQPVISPPRDESCVPPPSTPNTKQAKKENSPSSPSVDSFIGWNGITRLLRVRFYMSRPDAPVSAFTPSPQRRPSHEPLGHRGDEDEDGLSGSGDMPPSLYGSWHNVASFVPELGTQGMPVDTPFAAALAMSMREESCWPRWTRWG